MIVDEHYQLIMRPKTCSDECEKSLLGPHVLRNFAVDWYVYLSVAAGVRTFVDGRFTFVVYRGSGTDDYVCKHVYGAPSILSAKCAVCCGGMSNVDHLIKTGQVACKTFQKQVMPYELIEKIQKSYMPWLITRELSNPIDLNIMSDSDVHDFVMQSYKCSITNIWNTELISVINDLIVLVSNDE